MKKIPGENIAGHKPQRNKNQTPPTNYQTKRYSISPWKKLVGTLTNHHQQNPIG